MKNTNPDIDTYLGKVQKWQPEMKKLRKVALECQLTEELKWGKPCYTLHNKNIVLIQGFKDYCALLFFKGSLLKDANGILTRPGENSQAAFQARFTSLKEIAARESVLTTYIQEAIRVEQAGLKVDFKKSTELVYPEEFQLQLDQSPALKAAFLALTPGRQRAYNMFFTAPKLSKTRESRIEKCTARILNGEGLNDRDRG